jgi:hypothetical protein
MDVAHEYRCNVADINAGLCDYWAEIAQRLLRRAGIDAETWSTSTRERPDGEAWYPFHIFLKIGRKYYDAEAMGGVASYRDLPFFKRSAREYPRIPIEPW